MSGLGKHDWQARPSQSVHSQRTRTIYKSASGDTRDLKQRSHPDYVGFVKAWESSFSVNEAAKKTGYSQRITASIAGYLRKNGVKLKHMFRRKKNDFIAMEKFRQSIADERTKK